MAHDEKLNDVVLLMKSSMMMNYELKVETSIYRRYYRISTPLLQETDLILES